MEQDRLRDFLKFLRFQLNWLIVAGGFLLVMILAGSLYLSRMAATVPSPTQESPLQLGLETPPAAPITPLIVPEPMPLPRVVAESEYVVQAGDSLWNIARNHYGSGHYFSQISQANNLTNPGRIEVGQKLTLPEISIAQGKIASGVSIDLESQPPEVEHPQPTATYQVKPGDCLWTIAERELGDGYRWTEIYQQNLSVIGSNPDLIYPETELQLPAAGQVDSRLPRDSLLQ